ncbi:lactonase family protein [Kribbella sandramycini]|uniref:6-phosphogluconolactonase n=1 Tax=Kribbella sandramycini TaxID=60450 RepID=A0A7Y4KUX4_9ACTN|nr:lactonase family protein [Kribbella sandramycini]MBB6568227.1 6-phosphogluconolactonase [Kribbella sandramycini]NOL39180.1 lactonase family protein [Kribbella sandramycini]
MTTTRRGFLGLTIAAIPVAAGVSKATAADPRYLYYGKYGDGVGIATYDAAGKITAVSTLKGVADPSFVIRTGNRLYAVNEQQAGAVTAIAIDAPGKLRQINRQTNGGAAPCHLVVADGHVITANYTSGDVAVHKLRSDGGIGSRTDLVEHQGSAPHAHQVVQIGRYILAVDLGTDSVYTYTLTNGKLALKSQVKLKTGAGPRHLAVHPSGNFVYVANELDSTISVLRYVDGVLTVLNTQTTVPAGSPKNYPGEVIISADGRFVYLTNRGHNSIAVFAVNGDGSTLTLKGTPSAGGVWPRHCIIDPTGLLMFVSNQNSGNIVSFAVDPQSGGLTQKSSFSTPSPVCVNV